MCLFHEVGCLSLSQIRIYRSTLSVTVKANFNLEQATKVHRGSSCTDILFS